MRRVLEDETRIRLMAGSTGNLKIERGEKQTDFSPLHISAASVKAALRVARHCTVENTLRVGTEIHAVVA